jgi:nondiscriminating aspartyl-tRNA synthetase
MHSVEIQSQQIQAHIGERVELRGHAQAVRNLGNLMFINVRDRTGCVQVVVDDKSIIEQANGLSPEAAVLITGSVVQSPQRNALAEVHADSIVILSGPNEVPPVEISKQSKMDSLSLTAMLDYRPLTLRSPKVRAIFKVQAAICRAFANFLTTEEFVEIHSPKIVSTGTEGGANLFKLDYFGKEAFLAQSPQFYKQMMVGVFERVFEVGPVYRAEEHDTTRHLNEYVSLDFEMGFIESEQDLIAMQIRLMQHIFAHVEETCAAELQMYGVKVPRFESIPQLKLHEAQELLTSKLNWKPGAETTDLDPEGERLLCQYFSEKENTDLVYLTHYPRSVRPFYAMPTSAGLSHSFDLLFRGLEVTTGGQRLHRADELIESMKLRGLEPDSFTDYLQCFRYGMPPHGGLAIGLERLTKQLLNLPTVKLAVLFPRDRNRLTP